MSALTTHAQNRLADLDADTGEVTVLGQTSPVLATPAAAVGAGVAVTAAGIAGFVAEEAADN